MLCVQKFMMSFFLLGLFVVPVQLFADPPPPGAERVESQNVAPSEQDDLWGPNEAPHSTPRVIDVEPPSRVWSTLGQTGAGILGIVVFGFVGALVGAGSCVSSGEEAEWDALGCGYVGALAGAAIGTPISVWAVGEWIGWDGSLLATVAGVAIGAVAVSLAGRVYGSDATSVLLPAALIVVPAGGAVGYQLSADWSKNTGAEAMAKMTSIPIVHFEF